MSDASVVTQGIGARLRAARERAGLTSLQAAAKLHLEPRMIEALEGEEFAVLGAPVYVRGHLRRYAELVDAPVDELLAAYGALVEASAAPDLSQLKTAEPVRPPRQLAGPVVGVIVAGTVIAGIWLALRGLPSAKLPAAQPPPAVPKAAPLATPPAPAPAAAPPDTPAAAAPATAIPDSPQAGALRLQLAIRSDSWVEVYDSRGRRLYYDLARAPATLSLSGPAPLRVLLGYAEGVAVAADGQAVAVPASVRRGRSANFIVAADGAVSAPP